MAHAIDSPIRDQVRKVEEDAYRGGTEDDDTLPEKPPEGGQSWAQSGEIFSRMGGSTQTLPAGVFACAMSQSGPYLLKVKNDTDTLVRFPDGPAEEIIAEITQFQELRARFKEYGFLHKRGILVHGPPGSGKTVMLQHIIELLVRGYGGIALYMENPGVASSCLQMIRQIEPDRQIVGIMEDFDNLIRIYNPTSWLSMLDGENQVDNIVFVATTNYPENIDKRFTDRPSRFDVVRYVGLPSATAMAAYLKAKVKGMSDSDVKAFSQAAEREKYTIAHLKELIILTHCFGYTLNNAVQRIKDARNAILNSEKTPDTKKVATGFGAVVNKASGLFTGQTPSQVLNELEATELGG